jgi:acetyl-CoA carboxylase carboxyl transferase subunit alpha
MAIKKHLKELVALPPQELVEQRYQKFRKMGAFVETPS